MDPAELRLARPRSAGRVKSLDGFRGIAVLLVFASHVFGGVEPSPRPFASWTRGWLPGGGFVGVQMFFVLSGYLITGILLRELSCGGGVRVGRFWIRRMRRLYPALLAIVAASLLAALILQSTAHTAFGAHPTVLDTLSVPNTVRDALNALTYTTNLHPFTSWGWLDHTWSLAVEEQFYVLWPLTMLAGWRIGRHAGIVGIAAIGIIATIAARQLSVMSPASTYELLRWDALLLGSVLAVLVPRPPRFRGQAALGVAGLTVLGIYSLRTFDFAPQSYTIVAAASAAVMLACVSWKWIAHPILRYFGRISYSLYLWHVFMLHFGWPGPVSLVASVVLADLSYRHIERRFWTPHPEPEPESEPLLASSEGAR
ncbi:MAG TPA: acyltransferase [Gaiellaceae bacterium]|nr:acyltransferase [Gaiellaceae bacterium]